jgi:hypothetical protein
MTTEDVMKWSSDWHAEARKTYASRTVTYGRGANSTTLSASIGRTDHTGKDRFGVIEVWQSRDYLILANDLKISGTKTTPTAGDVITDKDEDGNNVKYKVVPDGNDCFRFSDKYGTRLRIFTKRMD